MDGEITLMGRGQLFFQLKYERIANKTEKHQNASNVIKVSTVSGNFVSADVGFGLPNSYT